MAKKRRDKKRDPSSAERITKAAKTALAIGAGAVLFANMDGGKNINELLSTTRRTIKGVNRDLLNKKKTASNIYDAYVNNIGKKGEVFKKARKEFSLEKSRLRSSEKNTLIGRVKKLDQNLKNKFNQDIEGRLTAKAAKDITDLLSNTFKDKYSRKQIKQIVQSASSKDIRNALKTDKDIGVTFLEDTIKRTGMDEDDVKLIVKSTIQHLDEKVNKDTVKDAIKNSDKLKEQIRNVNRETIKEQAQADNTLLNRIGKKFFKINDLEERLTGTRAVTIKDIRENETIRNQIENLDDEWLETVNLLNENNDWDNAIIDKNLRIRTHKDGSQELIDFTEAHQFFDDLINKFNSTLPGKVLTKGIDIKGIKNAPDYAMFFRGKKSMLASKTGGTDNVLNEDLIYAGNKVFSIAKDEDGNDVLGEVLYEGYINPMNHGTLPGIQQRWLGSERTEPLSSPNKILQWLDINQDGNSNFFKRITQFVTKFSDDDWERNIIDRVQERITSGRGLEEEIEYLSKQYNMTRGETLRRINEDNQLINNLFSARTASNAIDDDAVQNMLDTLNNVDLSRVDNEVARHIQKSQDLLELILQGDTEATFAYLTNGEQFYNTQGINNLIRNWNADSDAVMNSVYIETNLSKKIPILDMENSETNVSYIEGKLRTESLKEVFSDNDVMQYLMEENSFNGQQRKAILNLYQWSMFEDATLGGREFSDEVFALFREGSIYDDYITGLQNNQPLAADFLGTLQEMKGDFGLFHKGALNNMNERYYSEFNEYEFTPKSKVFSGRNMVENLNNLIKELNGGGDNPENISTLSYVSQYLINRLSYGVEDSGLGLSSKSLSSPLQSIKNIGLKRVLPAMAAFTAFDYLNDLSQDLTGVGITGAAANSIANLDVGLRGIAYGTGLGQALDWFKETSVIGEYWTGSTDFQTAEERKEWYREGYSPVRKSRFWSFGSASEFRGGDITFFQPNYLRRIHSDYRDEWLYGGNKEKWAHSIIPTPTHPLSTIRYLMDPYWLERKHIDDAPTPLTGKMFSEGTPWGAILNPTVGEVIKPQIMLPEVKRRLTGKGHDARQIVKNINERIKNRRQDTTNDDLIVINGTDIRNATYIPYGNPTANEINITNGSIRGINYMAGLSDVGEYTVPEYIPSGNGSTYSPSFSSSVKSTMYGISDQVFAGNQNLGRSIVESINNAIKVGRYTAPVNSASPDSSYQGTYVYNNMVNEYNTYVSNYYEDKYTPMMLNRSKYSDYMADAKHSIKNLSGIYGFLADTFVGENSFTYRYENAGSYSSFTKGFWDSGVGGLGGGVMEIARRFFPSSDKSRVDYNPLRNNVADWLPDYLQIGNPYSKLTKGEMRLPGKGYESLNELHPDEYGEYGAFDRFKILADVAPNSQEYKIWHNIVKHQIFDPELREEIKEIESRTKRMRGSHEFYDYQYLHTNTKYESGIVKEIKQNGQVVLANNQVLTLAGIEFNESYNDELRQLITPGKEITYRTTDDAVNDLEKGVIRNAAIYSGTDNINRRLIDMGVADRDETDTSAIGKLATVSSSQENWGAIQELIAHARIPIIHNKLMHVESPLEAFESEQIYGANFQTWDHPIEGFVKPMMNEVMSQSILRRTLAVAYRDFHFNKVLTSGQNKFLKFTSGAILATLDPSAMLGGTVNWMLRLNNGRVGNTNQVLGAWSTGAKYGSTIGTVAWGFANANNPIKAAGSFALAGVDLFNKLELGEFAERFGKSLDVKGAAVIGATIGLGVSALKNDRFDKDKMFGEWQPKKYKEKVALDEYFDRLEYIKYKGLYEDASRKAALIEGTSIKEIFREMDKNKRRIEKLNNKAKRLLEKYNENDSRYKEKRAAIQEEIDALTQRGNQMFVGGKYTKSAIAYKKAMESTIYGLSATATKDEILAAVPDQYKDYFQAFMDVTDESERKKILKKMPDYLKRPLQAAWGMEMEEVQSNRKYFKSHKLPGVGWRGWKPNINLKHVKMKTIENEGMLLADFGFYNSEKAKAQYHMAPDIENYDSGSPFSSSLRLMAEMRGLGIITSNVSIERTSTPGFWMTADIKQSIGDRYEVATNSMTNTIQSLTANFI